MFKKLTFEEAKKMSIWRWKNFPTGKPTNEDWEKSEFDIIPKSDCGFCEYYRTQCEYCPLFWRRAHTEPRSAYRKDVIHISRPCMREYWHWRYWYLSNLSNSKKMMKHWANKIVKKIEDAEEGWKVTLKFNVSVKDECKNILHGRGKIFCKVENAILDYRGYRYNFDIRNIWKVKSSDKKKLKEWYPEIDWDNELAVGIRLGKRTK